MNYPKYLNKRIVIINEAIEMIKKIVNEVIITIIGKGKENVHLVISLSLKRELL
ncbi:MAG: hypothetical protein Q8936_24055 [Bacillota bacterium]|nr:hypothetical protein [Bacillota bacterium]